MPKLKNCPSCYSSDVSSAKHGVANYFGTCNLCGVRGPLEGDSETAERGWNDMPRDPDPITLRDSVRILNRHGHMQSRDWFIGLLYDFPVASNGICNLTEFEARGIAREFLVAVNQRRKQRRKTKS